MKRQKTFILKVRKDKAKPEQPKLKPMPKGIPIAQPVDYWVWNVK